MVKLMARVAPRTGRSRRIARLAALFFAKEHSKDGSSG